MLMSTKDLTQVKSKITDNKDCRDYDITFNVDNTEQRWVGSKLGLLSSHPTAKIIKIIKLKNREL